MTNMTQSSTAVPCPVCEKTDGACSWTEDRTTVLCATLKQDVNVDAIEAEEAAQPEPKRKPNKNGRFRTPDEKERSVTSSSTHIESKVGELALLVAEKYESPGTARVILATWCKEFGYDKYAASQLLNEKLKTVRKVSAAYRVNEDHKLVRDDEAIRDALGDRLRYNEQLLQPELDGELFDPTEARVDLITRYDVPLKSSDKDICTLVVRYAKERPYHPIRDYLNAVHEKHGNDTQILEGFASRYFGAQAPIHQVMVKRFFIGAVARALQPGCKNDTAFILRGPQGWGKSTFFEVMASKPWFDDSFLSSGEKDQRLKLHYSWLIEWAELEVIFERRSISQVKAFLSCSTDKIRPPYGSSQQTLHRPSVIVGSTNEDHFLADPSGSRRYWVVSLSKRVDIAKLKKERDRIWAAAVALYHSGEQWWLNHEEEKLAKQDVKQYEEVHPWTYSIEDYLFSLEQVSTKEVLCNALDIPISKHNSPAQKRVSTILKNLGWEQTKNPVAHHNRRTRVWKKSK